MERALLCYRPRMSFGGNAMVRRLPLLAAILAAAAPVIAQDKKLPEKKVPPPKLLYTVPLVVKAGEKQRLTLRGMNLVGATEVKVGGASSAKVKFLATRAVAVPNSYPADRVGDSEIEIDLELPKDAKPGTTTLSVISPGGSSEDRTILLRGAVPATVEKEPNDGLDTAQVVTVPVAIEGTIQRELDPDVYRFRGEKGDRLQIEVRAALFGSPLDAMLVLHDSRRGILASADDTGTSPDPVLSITLPADGDFYLSVIDAHNLGGSNFAYQLVVIPAK